MLSIELCINDDGSMYIEQGEKEASEEESGNRVPVKSLPEALNAIKQMAEGSMMAPESSEETAPAEETDAMMGAYRPGTRGMEG